MRKKNSNRSGFPVIDTGPVNAKVKQKMINEAKKQAEKAKYACASDWFTYSLRLIRSSTANRRLLVDLVGVFGA